jgi:N-acetylneuraminate synthase
MPGKGSHEGKRLMPQQPCWVIAEVGSVHDGSVGNARKLIEAAASCGANAVKFQTHIAHAETLRDAPMPRYFKGEPRYEYFERTAFTPKEWASLTSLCDDLKIEFLSSPFSIEAVELLESLGLAKYKVPSGEVTNSPLLEAIAQTRKPVLLSSGMNTWKELDHAVNAILRIHDSITILQCTSEYPCAYEHVGLNVMLEMRERYRLPVGLSDHTLSPYASLAAVTLGASVVERHFTFSRLMYGSDAPHSLEPLELKSLIQGIRAIETMLSSPVDKDSQAESLQEMKEIFEKSVVSLVDIPSQAVITRDMVGVKKPGTGIPASRISEIIGRRVSCPVPKNTILEEKHLYA